MIAKFFDGCSINETEMGLQFLYCYYSKPISLHDFLANRVKSGLQLLYFSFIKVIPLFPGQKNSQVSGCGDLCGHANQRGRMSDQHPLLSAANVVGEIEHTHFLASHIGSLHLNDDYSDIIIIVEGERFKCHKVILAARSEYFR